MKCTYFNTLLLSIALICPSLSATWFGTLKQGLKNNHLPVFAASGVATLACYLTAGYYGSKQEKLFFHTRNTLLAIIKQKCDAIVKNSEIDTSFCNTFANRITSEILTKKYLPAAYFLQTPVIGEKSHLISLTKQEIYAALSCQNDSLENSALAKIEAGKEYIHAFKKRSARAQTMKKIGASMCVAAGVVAGLSGIYSAYNWYKK